MWAGREDSDELSELSVVDGALPLEERGSSHEVEEGASQ